MIPLKILNEFEKCDPYLDTNARDEDLIYGMLPLLPNAPEEINKEYKKVVEWAEKGIK